MTTGTLSQDGFKLSDVTTTIKEETVTVSEIEADHAFDLLMSDVDGYSPLEVKSTLQDKLQEISMLNDEVTLEESLLTPLSGIEANDVGSLYKQFMEYDGSDEALSYPDSSAMSPMYSPGQYGGDDSVLGTLMSVQEKLIEEVGDEEENIDVMGDIDDLVVALPNQHKLLRTVNGIHPKADSTRMADSPKFAKLKKKRLTKEPPQRNLSMPATPRCTSPSEQLISQEERKHMEIKLIEALALPPPKHTNKPQNNKLHHNGNKKAIKDILTKKSSAGVCTNKRKLAVPEPEPIPSRLIPVVSKRFKNNLEQSKSLKDPRLKEMGAGGHVDPRLNRLDYCVETNVLDLKLTNIIEGNNSSTNTASETVDDMCIIDMNIDCEDAEEPPASDTTTTTTLDEVDSFDATIDHGSLVKSYSSPLDSTTSEVKPLHCASEGTAGKDVDNVLKIVFNDDGETLLVNDQHGDKKLSSENENSTLVNGDTSVPLVNGSVGGKDEDDDDCLHIVEFPSLTAIEIKTEECEEVTTSPVVVEESCPIDVLDVAAETTVCDGFLDNDAVVNGDNDNNNNNNNEVVVNGSVKPKRTYRKSRSKTPNVNGVHPSSDSENECDDDDRAYNRKTSKKSKNSRILPAAYIKTENSSRKSRSRSSSGSRRASSRPSSRHQSRSPSRGALRSTVCSRRRSRSPRSPDRYHDNDRYRSDDEGSEFSYHSDRSNISDSENMDISNKLIELSNPVPYDIEHERKLRFMTGYASKSIGERRNIYAGGITEDTTKSDLADRFRRFGRITKITLHFRDKGDNYAFIVFEEPDHAMRAIEEGNDDPSFPHLDLCFGGRRKFVGGSYVDFDGNNRYLEESDKGAVNNRGEAPEDDFDKLLKMALTETKKVKREKEPEWT